MRKEILRMEHISKVINHRAILQDVSFNVLEGEILVLIGANGAGKTMLVEILTGIASKDQGSIFVEEEMRVIQSPQDANDLGIRYVHRDGRYIKNLTVMENLFLGREDRFLLDKKRQYVRSCELLRMVGLHLQPDRIYENLGEARERLIELASALDTDPRLIIIDEPMTVLKEHEETLLKGILGRLTGKGTSIIYITHSVREIMNFADRIMILRDGMSMGIYEKQVCDEKFLIGMMAGEEVVARNLEKGKDRKEAMRVENLNSDILKDISFSLYKGEIVGILGVVGSGKTQLLDAIFGVYPRISGEIYLEGKKVSINCPGDAISLKIGYVSEGWGTDGLVDFLSVRENITMPSVKRAVTYGVIRKKAERALVKHCMADLFQDEIDIERPVGEFSTGIKQKIRLCKWLSMAPDILLMDEPVSGVDVNSRKEIYNRLKDLSRQGMSLLIASEEIEEILQISDRILLMHEGRMKGELSIEEASQSQILSMIL